MCQLSKLIKLQIKLKFRNARMIPSTWKHHSNNLIERKWQVKHIHKHKQSSYPASLKEQLLLITSYFYIEHQRNQATQQKKAAVSNPSLSWWIALWPFVQLRIIFTHTKKVLEQRNLEDKVFYLVFHLLSRTNKW